MVTHFKGSEIFSTDTFNKRIDEINQERLQSNQNIYVSANGDDILGSGDISLPYATIDKALEAIPEDLNGYTVTIYMQRGSIKQPNAINKFLNGTIRIYGGGTEVEAQDYEILGTLRLENLKFCNVEIKGIYFTKLEVYNCKQVQVENCCCGYKDTATKQSAAMEFSFCNCAYVYKCAIKYRKYGIQSKNASCVYCGYNTGSNITYGYMVGLENISADILALPALLYYFGNSMSTSYASSVSSNGFLQNR